MPRPSSICPCTPCVHHDHVEIIHQPEASVPQRRPRPQPPRPQRKSGLYLVLQATQQHGITHPKDGHFLMLPKEEFRAILALEHKAVAQVVLEIFLARIIHQYEKSTRESTFGPR